jgi:tetratricopeptide (TPR) repeat protein
MRFQDILLRLATLLIVLTGCKRTSDNSIVVFRGADGRTITRDDLRGLTGTVNYEIIGKGNVPAEAEALHQQARQAGGAGDYKKAIALLEQAAKLAPQWPYPVYDMGYTYLLMKDAKNARKYYQKTVELAPRGFFTALTAADTLNREEKGDLPPGTYMAYLSLEWVDDPKKKAAFVQQLVQRVPKFAPGWKELADLATSDDAEQLKAIEKGLKASPDAETKGILQINKALITNRKGDHEGAVKSLGEIILDPASSYATEHMAKITLASITQQ